MTQGICYENGTQKDKFVCVKVCVPVRGTSLAMFVEFQHDLGGVQWRAGVGIQQQLFMLGQILCWGLLCHPSTVKQLPLQEGQVSLPDKKRKKMWVRKESIFFF